MQSLIRSKSAGVTGGRGTAGAGPGRDLLYFWKAMGLAYANPPFSLLAKVLTKIAYEGGRVVMCTPDWGCSGEHAYWRRMLDRMTVGRVQLPDGPIYVPEDSDTAMQA